MFELPEILTLAGQLNETVAGKVVRRGSLGNSPHKFVWYNRTHEEFALLTAGKRVGTAYGRGRWLFVPLEPGYVLLLGDFGGALLYHTPGARLPDRYHLWLTFEDGASLTAMTQMWGAMELHAAGRELERPYVKDMRPVPGEPAFTWTHFSGLVDAHAGEKLTAKGLLTQNQLIPGLGNAIAQDILFRARLHPKHPLADLDAGQRRMLYDTILATVRAVTACGGRNDEKDLYGRPGGYVRQMDAHAAGTPCPACGTTIVKIQYLGGACYFCPACQT